MRGGDPPRHPFWLFPAPGTRFPAPARFTPGGRLVSFPLCARCTPAARLGDPPSPAAFFSMPALRSPSLRLRPAPSVVLHGLWAPGPRALRPGRPSLFPRPPVCPSSVRSVPFSRTASDTPPLLPVAPSHLLSPANSIDPFSAARRSPIPDPGGTSAVASSRQTRPTLSPVAHRRSLIPDPPLLSPLSCRRRFPATFLPSRSPTPTGGSPVSSFSLLSEKEGESREAFPRIFVSLQP